MEPFRVHDMKCYWLTVEVIAQLAFGEQHQKAELASTLNGLARGTISEAPFEELSVTFSVPIVSLVI